MASFARPVAQITDWPKYALMLETNSIQGRRQALDTLGKMKGLPARLSEELKGDKKFLALDVIATLRLSELLPQLITLSESDETGAFYLAMNAVSDEKSTPTIARIYQTRLMGAKPTTVVSRMVMLDTLGRIGVPLPADRVLEFLSEPASELRSAAVYYARNMLLHQSDVAYIPVLERALGSNPYELRLQAAFAAKDLPESLRKPLTSALSRCAGDSNMEVQNVCRALIQNH